MIFHLLLYLFATATIGIAAPANIASRAAFTHPGLLHNSADLERVREHVQAGEQPWLAGYYKLGNSSYAQRGYVARPAATICRGRTNKCKENYSNAFRDFAACYQHALRWKISGDKGYADDAVAIINAWSSTLKTIDGSSDTALASGIYGYEFANCVELMRDYEGLTADNLAAAIGTLKNVFLPTSKLFLSSHWGNSVTHYWANWDLCNMAAVLSIGIVADDLEVYNYALDYFYNGKGMGAIHNFLWVTYPDGTAQLEESGRDQGHAMLDLALIQPFVAAAANQGVDLWAYDDNLILKGAEYAAKYNLGNNVSYTPFITWKNGHREYYQPGISPAGRGNVRPIWEMFYNEYVVKRGLKAPYVQQYAARVRSDGRGSEGGGGNYGGNSGGFDQLGFGTLLYSLPGTNATEEYSY
ncbi:hypothetical protein I317_07780 [Kwoniella heveanensis CBS 569]|uniref:Alginate lyase domain-containing protein n=1 Tax=Kwoniella heveanensis BCC8398 TaxID=1296120 RepID=A0A1B9GLX6_9TREE|nr:hypothetical protein I316_06408 [Kwoniella heveanensis BCC8398]OCF38446.1 hypothetical protein I317_07780 [Kwoniella heveanensis CBS 569]